MSEVTCKTCGKATYGGCGQHVNEVLAGVPARTAAPATNAPADSSAGCSAAKLWSAAPIDGYTRVRRGPSPASRRLLGGFGCLSAEPAADVVLGGAFGGIGEDAGCVIHFDKSSRLTRCGDGENGPVRGKCGSGGLFVR